MRKSTFNDPQFTFMVGEMLHVIADANALPRHIAILGLRQMADGEWPDADAIEEYRANLEADYHVRPLFYRIKMRPDGGEDHAELHMLLDSLVGCEHALPVSEPAVRAQEMASMPSSVPTLQKRFAIALSFPGERRAFVAKVAEHLATSIGRERVLYDHYFEDEFARVNLDTYLQRLYHEESELIATFICAEYEQKEWCGLEWGAIRDLIKKRQDDVVMLLRFDNTEIAGLFSTTGYVEISDRPPEDIATVILKRWQRNTGIQPTTPISSIQTVPTAAVIPVQMITTVTPTFPARWVHETTNDDKFTGREEERTRLDRWVRDEAVRVIGVCAVGGTGKTALVGQWLKKTAGWQCRPFAGLFAWSFYQERDSTKFLQAMLEWAHETLGTPIPAKAADLVAAVLAVLREHPLLVVLDGLEVLQEGPEDTRHGTFIDGALREFLVGLCLREHGGLAVLTSRFMFTDLERYLGTVFHQLQLPGLSPKQGAALLSELGVGGSIMHRSEVSSRLEGHPLGLRVFAEAIPDEERNAPLRFLENAFRIGNLSITTPLAGKIKRLLSFYQDKLPLSQVHLLSIVSLYRSPVAENAILRLMHGLFDKKQGGLLPDDGTLIIELQKLHSRGILTREPIANGYGYACHPILRDHFRAVLLLESENIAQRTADFLTGKPSNKQPQSVEEIEPILIAIELLLDAGEFKAADDLYKGRFGKGEIFRKLPAFTVAHRCTLGFVRDAGRRTLCERKLSRKSLSFYLNNVGIFASMCGHFDRAAYYYAEANAIADEMKDLKDLCVGLANTAELSIFIGQLTQAIEYCTEGLRLAKILLDYQSISVLYTMCGRTQAVLGQIRLAIKNISLANALEMKKDLVGNQFYTIRGIVYADLLLRSGHPTIAAKNIMEYDLRICEHNHWNHDGASCHWILGACALAEGRLDDAEHHLSQAEPVFHRGQLIFDLARLHITAGMVALARADATEALHRADEALALAQPRGMRLVHADALVLRGKTRLLTAEHPRALDDAEEALRLARECGYAWAERDALTLQADAYKALSDLYPDADHAARHRHAAQQAQADYDALAARLRLTEEDIAQAETEAAAWLANWEQEKEKGKSIPPH
ncbi:MAG: hypothetical protein ACYDBB_21785 [Armatimonadota bacterium]